eukprot:782491_1
MMFAGGVLLQYHVFSTSHKVLPSPNLCTMSTLFFILSTTVFISTTATFFLETLSLNQIYVKLETLRASSIHHGDTLSVELKILDNQLVYEVPDGVYVGSLHEVHFFSMGDIRIPCYAESISISFKINGDTVAAALPLPLYDLAASYRSLLPLELLNSHHHATGWILISSNDDQCFDGQQTHYTSQYSGISKITMSHDEYDEKHAHKDPETKGPKSSENDEIQTRKPKKPTHRIKTTDIVEIIDVTDTTEGVSDATTSTDTYSSDITATYPTTPRDMEPQFAVQQEILTLHQQMTDATQPTRMIETLQLNHTTISISQHTMSEIFNATNETWSLGFVCSEFVTIGDSFWNDEFIQNTLHNTTSMECVDVESFPHDVNESAPDTVSLFLLNGSNATSLQPISNNITNTKDNCDPIVVHLNWNANNEHDTDRYIPQCVYHPSMAWASDHGDESTTNASINEQCVPIYHDNQTVQCACQYFGSYSTSVQKNFLIHLQETIGHFDPIAVIVSCVYLIVLFAFLHQSCCCDKVNDVPLVSLEVYLPNQQRHRMWIITREGRTHFLLRYKFEKSTHKNCKKMWHMFRHFVLNDGLILPFFKRERGSNHYTLQRLVNLFWLILSILVVTEIITACNNDISPEECQYESVGYIGSDTYCMRANEIPIALVFVGLLCGWHFIHRLIFQRIHPNKLQMDLRALALLELKRYHKQFRSPAASPYKMIKNRYSKLEDPNSTNQHFSIRNFLGNTFTSLWTNVSNVMNPKYETASCQNTFNEHDIESTLQYLQEIKKHRHSIIESGQTENFEAFDYYYDGAQNDSMLRLDYGTGNDGDIEEEQDVELELRYVELDDTIEQLNGRRYSQECNRYNIAQLNMQHHAQAIEEQDESDDSDESVLTAILSGDSKASSRSSPCALSVNSMSFVSPSKPKPKVRHGVEDCHDRSNSRQSVSIHDSDDTDNHEEEKMSAPYIERNHSYSLDFESPSKGSTGRGNNTTMITDTNDHKSQSSVDNTILLIDSTMSLLQTPVNNTPNPNVVNPSSCSMVTTCHSNAPEPPSPLPDHRLSDHEITPAPSPRKRQPESHDIGVEMHNEDDPLHLAPIRTHADVSDTSAERSTVFIVDETADNTNFYVHVSPSEARGHVQRLSQDTPHSNATFIINSSESESEDDLTLRSPTRPTNDTENINDNAMQTNPISDPVPTDKRFEIGACHDITGFSSTIIKPPPLSDNWESEDSDSHLSATAGTLNSIDVSCDTVDSKPQENMPEIKENEDNPIESSTTLNWEEMDSSFAQSKETDIVLPQPEPTSCPMNAPRPMMNHLSPNRDHVRSYSYHNPHSAHSRTDLQLDATGDDTTTSASDDNEMRDALESSSGGDTMEIYDALSENDPFANHNNSSQGSSPSPIKNVENRSSDFYNEIQQRKTAMDAHYVIPYQWKVWICWYFAIFIGVLIILLIVIGSVTFDKTPKYRNTPIYDNKYSFLRHECRNSSNDARVRINDAYLMQYGQPFVDTLHFEYSDGLHWIVLSLISIAGMFVIYPLILWINAAFLIFRHSYYEHKGVDPLFICGFCPLYQRYSSPNAPQLSSVLDPNNLYLFNHNVSPGMTPNMRKNTKEAPQMFGEKEEEKEEEESVTNKIAFGLVTVDEEEYFDMDDHECESKHSMVEEPERCALPQTDEDSNEEDEQSQSDGNDGDDEDGYAHGERSHGRTASDVLKETLLNVNPMLSSSSSDAENNT